MGSKIHYNVSKVRHQIQDYTLIGNVGDALQQMAGHPIEVTEPGTLASEVLALYHFNDEGLTSIITDEKAAYTLTNNGAVAEIAGLFGGSFGAANFNGSSQYFTHSTLLETVPASIAVDFWIRATDGQPSGLQVIYVKINNESPFNWIRVFLGTDGKIAFSNAWAGSSSNIYSTTILPNGQTNWYHVTSTWDSINGMRLWVNGVLEAQNPLATTLFSSGSTRSFILGANNNGGPIANYFSGQIAYFRVRNKILSQRDVDLAYSTKYNWSSTNIALADAEIDLLVKEQGDDNFISPLNWGGKEVARQGSSFYRYGGIFQSTDKIRLIGRK